MALTGKQKAFVNAYLATFNSTEAARQAKYKGDDPTLASVGWENLRKPEIAKAIRERLSAQVMGPDEVLNRLAQHARSDFGPWLSDDGAIDIAAMKEAGATHLIHKVKRTERSGVSKDGAAWSVVTGEVELHDAQAALVHIGKHHGLFVNVSEIKGEIEINDATDARERIAGRIAGIARRNAAGGDTEGTDP